ncbi:hypothetical protein OC834_002142 [Tilletia horrida]|nr:hypothetical protein OC834_002142 [Tilletia horrida]
MATSSSSSSAAAAAAAGTSHQQQLLPPLSIASSSLPREQQQAQTTTTTTTTTTRTRSRSLRHRISFYNSNNNKKKGAAEEGPPDTPSSAAPPVPALPQETTRSLLSPLRRSFSRPRLSPSPSTSTSPSPSTSTSPAASPNASTTDLASPRSPRFSSPSSSAAAAAAAAALDAVASPITPPAATTNKARSRLRSLSFSRKRPPTIDTSCQSIDKPASSSSTSSSSSSSSSSSTAHLSPSASSPSLSSSFSPSAKAPPVPISSAAYMHYRSSPSPGSSSTSPAATAVKSLKLPHQSEYSSSRNSNNNNSNNEPSPSPAQSSAFSTASSQSSSSLTSRSSSLSTTASSYPVSPAASAADQSQILLPAGSSSSSSSSSKSTAARTISPLTLTLAHAPSVVSKAPGLERIKSGATTAVVPPPMPPMPTNHKSTKDTTTTTTTTSADSASNSPTTTIASLAAESTKSSSFRHTFRRKVFGGSARTVSVAHEPPTPDLIADSSADSSSRDDDPTATPPKRSPLGLGPVLMDSGKLDFFGDIKHLPSEDGHGGSRNRSSIHQPSLPRSSTTVLPSSAALGLFAPSMGRAAAGDIRVSRSEMGHSALSAKSKAAFLAQTKAAAQHALLSRQRQQQQQQGDTTAAGAKLAMPLAPSPVLPSPRRTVPTRSTSFGVEESRSFDGSASANFTHRRSTPSEGSLDIGSELMMAVLSVQALETDGEVAASDSRTATLDSFSPSYGRPSMSQTLRTMTTGSLSASPESLIVPLPPVATGGSTLRFSPPRSSINLPSSYSSFYRSASGSTSNVSSRRCLTEAQMRDMDKQTALYAERVRKERRPKQVHRPGLFAAAVQDDEDSEDDYGADEEEQEQEKKKSRAKDATATGGKLSQQQQQQQQQQEAQRLNVKNEEAEPISPTSSAGLFPSTFAQGKARRGDAASIGKGSSAWDASSDEEEDEAERARRARTPEPGLDVPAKRALYTCTLLKIHPHLAPHFLVPDNPVAQPLAAVALAANAKDDSDSLANANAGASAAEVRFPRSTNAASFLSSHASTTSLARGGLRIALARAQVMRSLKRRKLPLVQEVEISWFQRKYGSELVAPDRVMAEMGRRPPVSPEALMKPPMASSEGPVAASVVVPQQQQQQQQQKKNPMAAWALRPRFAERMCDWRPIEVGNQDVDVEPQSVLAHLAPSPFSPRKLFAKPPALLLSPRVCALAGVPLPSWLPPASAPKRFRAREQRGGAAAASMRQASGGTLRRMASTASSTTGAAGKAAASNAPWLTARLPFIHAGPEQQQEAERGPSAAELEAAAARETARLREQQSQEALRAAAAKAAADAMLVRQLKQALPRVLTESIIAEREEVLRDSIDEGGRHGEEAEEQMRDEEEDEEEDEDLPLAQIQANRRDAQRRTYEAQLQQQQAQQRRRQREEETQRRMLERNKALLAEARERRAKGGADHQRQSVLQAFDYGAGDASVVLGPSESSRLERSAAGAAGSGAGAQQQQQQQQRNSMALSDSGHHHLGAGPSMVSLSAHGHGHGQGHGQGHGHGFRGASASAHGHGGLRPSASASASAHGHGGLRSAFSASAHGHGHGSLRAASSAHGHGSLQRLSVMDADRDRERAPEPRRLSRASASYDGLSLLSPLNSPSPSRSASAVNLRALNVSSSSSSSSSAADAAAAAAAAAAAPASADRRLSRMSSANSLQVHGGNSMMPAITAANGLLSPPAPVSIRHRSPDRSSTMPLPAELSPRGSFMHLGAGTGLGPLPLATPPSPYGGSPAMLYPGAAAKGAHERMNAALARGGLAASSSSSPVNNGGLSPHPSPSGGGGAYPFQNAGGGNGAGSMYGMGPAAAAASQQQQAQHMSIYGGNMQAFQMQQAAAAAVMAAAAAAQAQQHGGAGTRPPSFMHPNMMLGMNMGMGMQQQQQYAPQFYGGGGLMPAPQAPLVSLDARSLPASATVLRRSETLR